MPRTPCLTPDALLACGFGSWACLVALEIRSTRPLPDGLQR